MGKSTKETLPTLNPPTSLTINNTTSLPGSPDGRGPSSLPGGPQSGLFGRAQPLVSLSALQASTKPTLIAGTSGRLGLGSSASVALQSSLVSRLQRQLDLDGGIEFVWTWKGRITPARRRYCQLVASARPSDESGFIGWHSPAARDWKDSPGMALKVTNKDGSERNRIDQLPRQARLCLTPPAWMRCTCCEDYLCTIHGEHVADCECPPIDEWETMPYEAGSNTSSFLAQMAGGALDPAFSLWLLGFPPEWINSAPRAMPSSRKSPPNLSGPQ